MAFISIITDQSWTNILTRYARCEEARHIASYHRSEHQLGHGGTTCRCHGGQTAQQDAHRTHVGESAQGVSRYYL